MRYILLLLLLLSGLAVGKPVKTASHVEAELVAEQTAAVPGVPFYAGLRLKMDPHWHTYWSNPGEAGLPTTLTWALPPGWKAEDLQYPVPDRFTVSGLLAYTYEDEVLLPVRVTPPADLKPGTKVVLKAKAEWLACDKTCIPGEAELELEMPLAEQAPSSQWMAAFEAARRLLPQTEPPPRTQLATAGSGLELRFSLPEKLDGAFFAPAETGVLNDADEPKLTREGDLYKLALVPSKPLQQLKGVLVVREGKTRWGYALDLKVGEMAKTAGPSNPVAPSTVGLGTMLGFAFLGGLILNLMPCVFPVLTLKVMGVMEQANEDHSKPWLHGLAFTLGVLLSFWLLVGLLVGLRSSGQAVGWGFQLQSPAFVLVMASLFFLIGLNLLGVFEVGEDLTRLGDLTEGKTGYSGSLFSGALATLVATPCSAPLMGAAVGAALEQSNLIVFLVFTMLGLGMAFPYLLLTSVPGLLRFVPRPGAWMETFKQAMAFPMFFTVAWLGWTLAQLADARGVLVLLVNLVILGLASWILGRWGFSLEGRTAARARVAAPVVGLLGLGFSLNLLLHPVQDTGWKPYNEEQLQAARAEGKVVFVDFTAAWCLSCQVNERVTLDSGPVQAAFKQGNVVLFKADWTKKDPVITAALARFGRSSVPLYVVYPKNGEPFVLPEVITPGVVTEALQKAAQ